MFNSEEYAPLVAMVARRIGEMRKTGPWQMIGHVKRAGLEADAVALLSEIRQFQIEHMHHTDGPSPASGAAEDDFDVRAFDGATGDELTPANDNPVAEAAPSIDEPPFQPDAPAVPAGKLEKLSPQKRAAITRKANAAKKRRESEE